MDYRSKSPKDKNNQSYNHSNKGASKKKYSNERGYSSKRHTNYEKSKRYSSKFDKNHDQKREKENIYSNPNDLRLKSGRNRFGSYSNDEFEPAYNEVNYNTDAMNNSDDDYGSHSEEITRKSGERRANKYHEDDFSNPEDYGESLKDFDINYDKNMKPSMSRRHKYYEYKNPKNFSKKIQGDYSNDKLKATYDVEYNNNNRFDDGYDYYHKNSEKHPRQSKGKRSQNFYGQEDLSPGKHRRKSEFNRNMSNTKKNPKVKSTVNYSSVDYDDEDRHGRDRDCWNSENEDGDPEKDYMYHNKTDYPKLRDGNDDDDYDDGGFGYDDEFVEESGNVYKPMSEKEKNIQVITRLMWDSESNDTKPDKLPQQPFNHINYVDTSSPMCHDHEGCVEVLQFIKERDKSIKHNFYIGGDNLIYEGKGWVADVNEDTGYRKRAIDIAFIGTFSVKKLPKKRMIEQASDFVYYCIISRMLYQNFTCTMFKEYPIKL